jgi:aminoglycoside/choline kinase family phosphotransferase
MTAFVPRHPSDFTAAWLSEALKTDISDVQVTHTIPGTATKILLRVVYSGPSDLPPTMCFKGGMGDHAEFMAQVGIYATEARFFRDELQHSKVRAPRVYWADVDEALFGAVLIEDLNRPAVRFCDARTPLRPDEVSAVLDNVALLHAGRWNSPWLETATWLEHFASPESKGRAYFSMLGPEVIQDFVDKRRQSLPTELADAQRCTDLFWAFVEKSEKGPQTLLHGDLHVGNVYFDGAVAALCDWQVLGRGSPAFDVAYLIGSAMTIDDRRESERQLLQRYLDALTAAGVADPPEPDEMWSLYRTHMAYGLYAWLTNLEAFQEGDIIDEVVKRFAAAVLDLNTAEAVGIA